MIHDFDYSNNGAPPYSGQPLRGKSQLVTPQRSSSGTCSSSSSDTVSAIGSVNLTIERIRKVKGSKNKKKIKAKIRGAQTIPESEDSEKGDND